MTDDLRDSNIMQLAAQDNWSIKAKKKPSQNMDDQLPIVESVNYELERKENEE